jgi:hypothetical protein
MNARAMAAHIDGLVFGLICGWAIGWCSFGLMAELSK